ncbi:50S ribosome-binding GTPase [Fodinisporobacter ferrooxydans]|uniref:50S ribosome-binding GTPase n=1 Tax=Fodinisporobacter ferrooxydans TaxID=2901836 RepID=A0ABY4CGP3_9BACL|nr:50S ribosome-binding GTPase [Alicyclobacillaceae bacterium MYW30-H2]
MKTCLVIGRTNVGKTLFCVNFAEFIGLSKIDVYFTLPDGSRRQKRYEPAQARHELSGIGQHRTRCLQSIRLELPQGKGTRQFLLTDSTGLAAGIHPDQGIRYAMAQTLDELRYADCILHMVDVHPTRNDSEAADDVLTELDRQIAEFGQTRVGYAMLVNKVDLPGADEKLEQIQRQYNPKSLLPISALYRKGFREVKEYVWRMV